MKISIFTPTHNPRFIKDAYLSIKNQTYINWEWVLLINNDIKKDDLLEDIQNDPQVNIVSYEKVKGVGQAKKLCCEHATGDILLELDHDDILGEFALQELVNAYNQNPNAVFIYSNFVQINEDNTPNKDKFSEAYGWQYRELEGGYNEFVCFDPHPHNVAYLWYAPNHLRSFTKKAYDLAGGYNEDQVICDDADLMCRLYLQGEFVKIDKPLYFQRIHPNQTQRIYNKEIQQEIQNTYERYLSEMILKWTERKGLLSLEFGAAHRSVKSFKSVDIRGDVDIRADLSGQFPWEDNSVGVIRAVDFLEHIYDKIRIIKEIYRVLAPGGMLLSLTPSTDGRGAFQDPTHCAFYNENSFWYYTRKVQNNFVDGLDVRFQESKLRTYFLSDYHKENNIPYVQANLIAIKSNKHEYGGLLQI